MANSNNYKKVVPAAKDALNKFKYEVASEVGVNLKDRDIFLGFMCLLLLNGRCKKAGIVSLPFYFIIIKVLFFVILKIKFCKIIYYFFYIL